MVVFGDDITADDVTFLRAGASNDLEIRLGQSDDVLTITGQFAATYTGPFGTQWFDRIEVFAFSDGDSLTWQDIIEDMNSKAGTPNDDIIYGFSYDDVLDPGPGDDLIMGGNGEDTYIFGGGYGTDVVNDSLANILSGMNDTVVFREDVAPEDVSFHRDGPSNDLVVTLASGDSLRIQDQFLAFSTGPFGTRWFNRIEAFQYSLTGQTLDLRRRHCEHSC